MTGERRRRDAIRDLVGRCDLCVVDLDECIYPNFTQSTLGALLGLECLRAPYRHLLPQLLAGGAYLATTRLRERMGVRPSNHEQMAVFSRVVRGVPLALVEQCSQELPRRGPQGWRSALGSIAAKMEVMLLTFSIEPIAGAYAAATGPGGGPIFSGYEATRLLSSDGVVQGCAFTRDSLSPEAKVRTLEALLARKGRDRPLVIGHGPDELGLADRARTLGGGSIGIGARGLVTASFDIDLEGDGWARLEEALQP